MILNMISGGDGTGGTLTITAPANTTVTISKDDITKTKTADVNGIVTFNGMETGIWTVTITDGSQTTATTVDVTIDYTTTIEFFATIAVTFQEGYTCTCSDGTTTLTAPTTAGSYTFIVPYAGTWTASCTDGEQLISKVVTITTKSESQSVELVYVDSILDNNSWAKISEISEEGTGKNYWSVGDCKSVYLSGTMGTVILDTTLWAYILGFDHNKDIEGSGIQFGCFKTNSDSSGIDVCLIDGYYLQYTLAGTKYFSINHDTSSIKGGWAVCDARYDILGSTDIDPSTYDVSIVNAGITGCNATTACATNPVANTLMSCLPSKLRAVMKPITKWTDNRGHKNAHLSSLSTTIDYLPLLAEFEILGTRKYANEYEQQYQMQYEYYSAGNTNTKYEYSNLDSLAAWWTRSVDVTDSYSRFFCYMSNGTSASLAIPYYSRGIAPVFMV